MTELIHDFWSHSFVLTFFLYIYVLDSERASSVVTVRIEEKRKVDHFAAFTLNSTLRDECDDSLLVHTAKRDPEAFCELYKLYRRRVYLYFRIRMNSEEDAADLTQQVFLRALDALPRYKEKGKPFSAWLFRIAHNLLVDSYRRNRDTVCWDQVSESSHPTTVQSLEDTVIQCESSTRLRVLLSGLPREEYEMLSLRFAAGLKIAEIASVLGKSESTVKRHLAATLRTLKEELNEE